MPRTDVVNHRSCRGRALWAFHGGAWAMWFFYFVTLDSARGEGWEGFFTVVVAMVFLWPIAALLSTAALILAASVLHSRSALSRGEIALCLLLLGSMASLLAASVGVFVEPAFENEWRIWGLWPTAFFLGYLAALGAIAIRIWADGLPTR